MISKSINLIFVAVLVSCFAFVSISSAKSPRAILSTPELSKPLIQPLDYFEVKSPEYPKVARQKGWEGTVVLKVLVSEEGNPTEIAVERSAGHKVLDEAALDAVSSWKFQPAQYENSPYPSMVLVPIQFALSDAE